MGAMTACASGPLWSINKLNCNTMDYLLKENGLWVFKRLWKQLMGSKRGLLASSSLKLISKVPISRKDLLKSYSGTGVLKDKCGKWYFVPKMIFLPWAHERALHYYVRVKSFWGRHKMVSRDEVAVTEVSGSVWRSWAWHWPEGALPVLSTDLGPWIVGSAYHRPGLHSSRMSLWSKIFVIAIPWPFSNPSLCFF